MHRRVPGLLVGTLSLWLALAPRVAFGDDPPAAAAALIEQGLDLRQAQKDAEALVLFERAEALAPSPRGRAQVALAEQALGRWAAAERDLQAAMTAKDDPWIASRRPVLEHAMTVIQGHLGDVEIAGATRGDVYVDGAPVTAKDALTHLRLEVGQRMYELRAVGWYPVSRLLDVRPGEVVRVEIEQHKLLAPVPAPEVPATVSPAPPAPARETSHTQRTLGWVALGGAGVFAAVGAAGLIDHEVAAHDFNANATCTGQPSNALSAQCRGWIDDGNTGQTLAIIGFAGAGVVAALSVALLLTAPSSTPKGIAWSLPCAPSPGGLSCSLGGTF